MSTPVIFNGSTYTIPAVGDVFPPDNWGQNLSNFFIAIPQGCLQQTGGLFSLANEVNFGPTFGILSAYYKSLSANVAAAGNMRLAVSDSINWRNNANSSDLALSINSSDQLLFNGALVGGEVNPANALYVALNGNDSNDGSLSFPFLTISAAIAAANPGTTIFIFPGGYTENLLFVDGVNVSASSKGAVNVTGNLTVNLTNGINVFGINFQCSSGDLISFAGSNASGVTFEGCSFSSQSGGGHGLNYSNSNAGSGITFNNSDIGVILSGPSSMPVFVGPLAAGGISIFKTSVGVDNPDNIAIQLDGSVSLGQQFGAVFGQLVLNGASSYQGAVLAIITNSVPAVNHLSSGSVLLLFMEAISGATPAIVGTGPLSCNQLLFLGAGSDFSASLNGGSGVSVVSVSPLGLSPITAPSVTQDGLLYYTGSSGHLYFSIGGTSYQLDQQAAGSVPAFAAFGSVPNAQGASISGSTITLEPASASFPGGVSTAAQSFAGAKTFVVAPSISSLTPGSVLFSGASGLVSQDNANLFWDDTNLGLGLGVPSVSFSFSGSMSEVFLAIDDNGGKGGITITKHSNTINTLPTLYFNKSDGTQASPLVVQTGDQNGLIGFTGFDGATYRASSAIQGTVNDPSPSSTSMAGNLSFYTTNIGAVVPSLSLQINNDNSLTAFGQIHGVTNPTSAQDAATKNYVDSAGGSFLQIANNLSDVASASSSFNNISPVTSLGDLIVGSGANSSARLAIGSQFNVLSVNGSGTAVWGQVNLAQAAAVSGVLAATNGGTGLSSYSVGNILYASGVSALSSLAIGTNGQVLSVSGGIPSWQNAAATGVTSVALTVPSFLSVAGSPITSSGTLAVGFSGTALPAINGGTGQIIYTTGNLLYASSSTALSNLAVGSNGQVLTVSGGLPVWAAASVGTVTSVALTVPSFLSVSGSPINSSGTLAVTLSGTALPAINGGTGQITYATGDTLYASAANTLSKLSVGTNGNVYQLNAGIPSWAPVTLSSSASVTGILSISNGGTGTSAVTVAPTATSWAGWDANSNMSADNFLAGSQSVSANTTLTVNSPFITFITGAGGITITLPVVSTLALGTEYLFINNSSGTVSINSSGANLVATISAASTATLINNAITGTSAAVWNVLSSSGGTTTFVQPTVQKFTSLSGTYVTPSGVSYIVVKMVGAGGGGAGSGSSPGSGGTGGSSTFGSSLLSCVGGSGAVGTIGGAGGTASLGSGPIGTVLSGGSGGGGTNVTGASMISCGGVGGNNSLGGGGGGGQAGTAGSVGALNTGGGGGGASGTGGGSAGGGGGSGGYVQAIINSPSSTYAYAVGAAGTAGAAGGAGFAGAIGGSGYVEVTEYYNGVSSGTSNTYVQPTIQKFLSSSGTYSTPAGVAYIQVSAVGGGGGGSGSGTGGAGTGVVGTATTFGSSLISAGPGAGGSPTGLGGTGGTSSLGASIGIAATGSAGQTGINTAAVGLVGSGGNGGPSSLSGAGVGGANGGGSTAGATNTGGGGGGAGGGVGINGGSGGGSGGYVQSFINNPASTYSYSVGTGGGGGTAGTSGSAGSAGGSGVLEIIEYYYASTAPIASISQVNLRTFTASGTYTPTTNMKYCIVEVIGNGGGGGGCVAAGGFQSAAGSGGGAGGYARAQLTSGQIGASQTVTIGVTGSGGGAGNNPGTAGGSCSLGSLVSATGGAAGGGGALSITGVIFASGGVGGLGALGGGVNGFVASGGSGNVGYASGTTGTALAGFGGNSYFQGGAITLGEQIAGVNGNSYGAGGSAGASSNSAAAGGGSGATGIVIVTEYI